MPANSGVHVAHVRVRACGSGNSARVGMAAPDMISRGNCIGSNNESVALQNNGDFGRDAKWNNGSMGKFSPGDLVRMEYLAAFA